MRQFHLTALFLLVICSPRFSDVTAGDLSLVPLWNGETTGGLTNRFGGGTNAFNGTLGETAAAQSGSGGYVYQTNGTIPAGGFGFIQTSIAPTGPSAAYVHSRDLTGFDQTEFWLRNDTGAAFDLKFEIKDYRKTNSHQAFRRVPISSASGWQKITAPLDLAAPGWTVVGSPDLERAERFSFVFEANQGQAVNGSVFFDDFSLIEAGGSLDIATASTRDLAERLAERQWNGLWGARNRDNGLIPLHNTSGGAGAMNTTSAVLKMLPGAVERGWVTAGDADGYVGTLVGSLNQMMDSATYLPPRYMDWVTLAPTIAEESPIDTAFMALALHQYKNQPGISPTLAAEIGSVQNRFDFSAFSDTEGSTRGWKLAYRTDGSGFTDGTYNGYSGEPWLISLAAHLADTNHVDITEQYHSAIFRAVDHLRDPGLEHVVHSNDSFRAPFLQWLMPLFVDVSDRGNDTYPIFSVSTNPRTNAELYQQDVAAYFEAIGRGLLLQPDAGDGGPSAAYEQYSAYNNFGQSDLFMPWAVTQALLGDEAAADAALRAILEAGLAGPLGLADSARWTTGAAGPSETPAFLDLWNTSLSTMALIEYLYGEASSFAELPEVASALDGVFLLAGDYDRSGFVSQSDLDLVLLNWGRDSVLEGVPGGWTNDLPRGLISQNELDRVLLNWGDGVAPALSAVPEPTSVAAMLMMIGLLPRRRSRLI